jgi:oligo-1,6-glucosidase
MRATPFIYNGDEIGMVNIRFKHIEDYQDIETKHVYRRIKDSGGDVEAFIKDQQLAARDNGRTPFQWNQGINAGFTRGKPWLKVHPNFRRINVAAQEDDPSSVLNFVRHLIGLRKSIPALVIGEYHLLLPENTEIYAYYRRVEGDCCLVLLNFSSREVSCPYDCPIPVGSEIIMNNYPGIKDKDGHWWLRPYQALIFRIKK